MTERPMRYAPHLMVVAGALLMAGCATASDGDALQATGAESEACYQFERNAAADRFGLPWGFVLTPEALDEYGGLERRVAATLDGPDARRDFPFAAWWFTEDGATRIGPEITGSVQLTLRPEGRALVGEAMAIGDALPPGGSIDRTPVQGVVAQQVLCGAAPGSGGV